MYEALTDRVGFVPGGVNIGVIRVDDKHALLVDTGLNDSTARKVLRWIKESIDSDVVGILTTHGHADHFGAHAFVVKRTGARVFAPDQDEAVIRNPLLQPMLLFGGADPMDTLRTRFLLADACGVDEILQYGQQRIMGVDLEVISLKGHSMNQVGFLVDGVFFCADVVFPESAIEKYRIPYLYGLTDHFSALEQGRAVSCEIVVPGHGPREESFEGPYQRNRVVIDLVLNTIVDALDEPMSGDQVAASVFRRLSVPVQDHPGYFLLRPTISAYLAHLHRSGEVDLMIEDGAALWCRL